MTPHRMPALFAGCLLFLFGSVAPAQDWGTLKGKIVLPDAPKPQPVNVTTDKEFCTKDGPVLDESLEVGPDGGVKNVVVWLRPDSENRNEPFPAEKIHPDLAKAPPATREIDQPCCQFIPRIVAARAGDSLVIKNSAKVPHNINMNGDPTVNPSVVFNITLPPGAQHQVAAPLAAQRTPVPFKCDIHPWMKGLIRVVDHPYFAITTESGEFKIENAPVGKWRLVVWHEGGFHKGREGALGLPVEVKAGEVVLDPIRLELPK